MPIYEYQGQQYEIQDTDPQKAKEKILAYLGTQQAPAQPEKRDTTITEDMKIGLGNAAATVVRGAGLIAGGVPNRLGYSNEFADSMFKGSEDLAKSIEDYWTPPDAEQKTMGGKLIGMVPTLPMQMAAMPFSPGDTGRRMLNNGESLETATTGTMLDTAGNLAGIAAPASIGGNVLSRMVTGGAMNAAQDSAVRGMISTIAEQDKTKKEFEPTLETAALSGTLGAGMGALIPNVKTPHRPDMERPNPGWAHVSPTMSDFEFKALKEHYKVISERIAGISEELNVANKLIEDGVTDPNFLKYVEDLESKLKSAQDSFAETEAVINNPMHTTKQQKTDLAAIKDSAIARQRKRLKTLKESKEQQASETVPQTIRDEADAALAKIDGLKPEAPQKKTPIQVAEERIIQASNNIGLVRRYREEVKARLGELLPRESEAGRPGNEFSALRDALETELRAYDALEAHLTGKEPNVDAPRTDVEVPRIDEHVPGDTNPSTKAKTEPVTLEDLDRLYSQEAPQRPVNTPAGEARTQDEIPLSAYENDLSNPTVGNVREHWESSGKTSKNPVWSYVQLAKRHAELSNVLDKLHTIAKNSAERGSPSGLDGAGPGAKVSDFTDVGDGRTISDKIDSVISQLRSLESKLQSLENQHPEIKQAKEKWANKRGEYTPVTKETPPKYDSVQSLLDSSQSPVTAFLDNPHLLTQRQGTKLRFDPQIPVTLQNVLTHFLDKLGLSKSEQIFFVVDEKLRGNSVGEHDIYGNSAVIKISPDRIAQSVAKHQAKDPGLFERFTDLPKNAWNRYLEAKIAAHEIGHHLMLKWVHQHSFDTGILKSPEVQRLMNEFTKWRQNPKDTQRYDNRKYVRDNFAEFFAEEVSRTLMNRHLFDAVSKGPLLNNLVKLIKTTQEYFNSLGISERKHAGDTFVSDLVEDIITRNKESFGSVWDAYELAKHNKMASAMPTLEDTAVALGRAEGELLPDYKIFADDPTKAASMSDNYSYSTITKLMSKAFGKTSIAHIFRDNPVLQQAYWFTRDAALEASKASNLRWHGKESFESFDKRSVFTKFSRVKNGDSPYHTIRMATDEEMFRILKIFEKGFEERLPYAQTLEKYGQHLTAKEKQTFNTLSDMFKGQYDDAVKLQQKLDKKHELPFRDGWFPSVRKGDYVVNLGFGGEISRRQHFATKEAAQAFIDRVKKQNNKLLEVSEPLPARVDEPNGNARMVEVIKDFIEQKYPNAGKQITADINKMLENMAKRGGKLGQHHEYREGITGYKGTELFYSDKEQGRSFKEAVISSVDEYSNRMKSLYTQTKLRPMLENPNIDVNTKLLIQQMYDSSLNLNKNIMEGLDSWATETMEKASRKVAESLPFTEYKGKSAKLTSFANNSLELLYLMKIMAKPAFILAQVMSPLQSLRHMSYDSGIIRPWISFGKGMVNLASGDPELKRAMYETRNETHTFEPQFIDALHLTEKQNFVIEGLKDWILLRKPAEFADTMSRVMTFSAMFSHYRDMGKSYSEAKRLAQHGTDSTMIQYNRTETAPMFQHFGGIGTQMRPLQTYPTAALGNLIGDLKHMKLKDVKTWAPMVNYALTSMILGGVLSLQFIQEYEAIRKLIANTAPEYAPPSVTDIMLTDPNFMDRVEVEPNILQKAAIMGIPAAVTGVDVASSLRTNEAFFTVLAGIALGQKEWYEVMPIMSLYGDFTTGMSTIVQNRLGDGVSAADMNKAIGKVFPAGIASYAAKEKIGVNETKLFGEPTGMKIGGKDGEATSPRTQLDKVAGYMGTKTTQDRLDIMVNMRKRELDKQQQERIKKNANLFVETNKPIFMDKLIALGASDKEIENAIGNQAFKKLVDQKERYYMTRNGRVNPQKAERALQYHEVE